MRTVLRFNALLILLSLVPSVGFCQVRPPPEPNFIFEDFDNDGVFDDGVDQRILDIGENYNPRTKNTDISIWNSEAGWDALAGIVIPRLVHRLDAGAVQGSNIFIYTQGVLRIGHGMVLRADSIEITGDAGVILDAVTLNGNSYLNVNGPLQAVGCTMHANYLINYSRESGKYDRCRVVGEQFCTVTADAGRLDVTRTVLKAGWVLSTRGEMHGDALVLNAPEVDVWPGDETSSVGHTLTRTTVNVGTGGGLFNLATGWGEDPKPVDFSKSAVVGSAYYQVYIYGSPCLIDKGAFRGVGAKVTIIP